MKASAFAAVKDITDSTSHLQMEFKVLTAFIFTVDFFVLLLNVSYILNGFHKVFMPFPTMTTVADLLFVMCLVAISGLQGGSWNEERLVCYGELRGVKEGFNSQYRIVSFSNRSIQNVRLPIWTSFRQPTSSHHQTIWHIRNRHHWCALIRTAIYRQRAIGMEAWVSLSSFFLSFCRN